MTLSRERWEKSFPITLTNIPDSQIVLPQTVKVNKIGITIKDFETVYWSGFEEIIIFGSNCKNPSPPQKSCLRGYYRYNGECYKCNCNDNEETCYLDEYNNIKCICKSGFCGKTCSKPCRCRPGYYEDTFDMDRCKPCDCNEREKSCYLEYNHLKCICKEAFYGPKCQLKKTVPIIDCKDGMILFIYQVTVIEI